MILNSDKALISHTHSKSIQNVFNSHIRGDLNIDHFSVNIFFGNKQSIFLSPTPKMAEELCKTNFVDLDSNYKPEIYHNHSIYPWRAVQKTDTDRAINLLKEEKFGMRSGMMIVRDLGQGCYVMYSIATHKRDHMDFPGQFYFLFHCKANYIAEMGDFMYDNLLPIINEYTEQEGISMPSLNRAQPIDLESSLQSEQQKELFEVIQSGTNVNLQTILQKRNAPILKLIKGGCIKNRLL